MLPVRLRWAKLARLKSKAISCINMCGWDFQARRLQEDMVPFEKLHLSVCLGQYGSFSLLASTGGS